MYVCALQATVSVLSLGAACDNLAQALVWEYRLAVRITSHPDFAEGVRAQVIDKDKKPKWQALDTSAVQRFFRPFAGGAEPAADLTFNSVVVHSKL